MTIERVVFIHVLLACVMCGALFTAPSVRAGDVFFAVNDLANGVKAGTFIPASGQRPEGTVKIRAAERAALVAGKSTLLEDEIIATADKREALAAVLIKAPVSAVKHVFYDYPAYVSIYPELKESRVLKQVQDEQYIVAFQIFDSWPKKKFYTHVITGTPNGITWRLATMDDLAPYVQDPQYADCSQAVQRSLDDFQINQGAWQLIPLADDPSTLLGLYRVSLKLRGAIMGSGLATKILNGMTRDDMPSVTATVKREAEQRANAPAK